MQNIFLNENEKQELSKYEAITNREELIEKLNPLGGKLYGLHLIWAYRHLYEQFEDSFDEMPVGIKSMLTSIATLHGNVAKAEAFLEKIKETEPEYIYALTCFAVPEVGYERLKAAVAYLDGIHFPRSESVILNVNRPTIMSGMRDFYPLKDFIRSHKEEAIRYIRVLHGDTAPFAYDIADAEMLYEENKCYEALVKLMCILPYFPRNNDYRVYFVALYLQLKILVLNDQVTATYPLIQGMWEKLEESGTSEFKASMTAIEILIALYECDYEKMNDWLLNCAPDENEGICMIDVMTYFVKIRCYIVQKKELAALSLAHTISDLLKSYNRPHDYCELTLLESIALFSLGQNDDAFNVFDECLDYAEKYCFIRLIADEGSVVVKLIQAFLLAKPDTNHKEFLNKVIEPARILTSYYPQYLSSIKPVNEALTASEKSILRLAKAGLSNQEIAATMCVSLPTVKFHISNILRKLGVENRSSAAQRASELGII